LRLFARISVTYSKTSRIARQAIYALGYFIHWDIQWGMSKANAWGFPA
jgi:hypothetical protein